MKDFLKMVLAAVCGIVIVTILAFSVLGGIAGTALSSGSATVLPKSGVLEIDLSTVILSEQSSKTMIPSDLMSAVNGSGSMENIGIWDAVQAINKAADDPAVKFIYLKSDGNLSDISHLQELRTALKNFRYNSGKAVISFIESPDAGSYYVSSVADKVYMSRYLGSNASIIGVSSQMIFLGDLLGRLGVNVQLIKHGKYKSAGEMFTRSNSTPENREQQKRMVDSIWETLSGEIAEGRSLSVEQVNDCVDNIRLNMPEDFIRYGFADELLSSDGLKQKLADLAMVSNFKDVKFFCLSEYISARAVVSKAKEKIAIIYADGEIVDGKDKEQVAGDRFAGIIANVRRDSSIKAVVLRVNSPGGSVLASEKIKEELDLLKESRPVIASYGSMAASGGYWISNNCDKIFANATTLTGSIGVFGIIPDISKTAKDIAHIGIENVTSNPHADMLSLTRPFDKVEYDYMLRSIECIYDKFTKIVSEGRGIPVETVDAIGQGRVWTGSDALKINLVDELGTLEDAIDYAALCAGNADLANWKIVSYPAPQNELDAILSLLGMNSTGNEASLIEKVKANIKPQVLARMDANFEIR